ncbi:hypothetical protein GGR50DRAFT_692802 [Xylaria sp. CBS 124048]|nr:hypothetical protein GGR50DRAFT_692802 [Xylaria sp. CBS 124048]
MTEPPFPTTYQTQNILTSGGRPLRRFGEKTVLDNLVIGILLEYTTSGAKWYYIALPEEEEEILSSNYPQLRAALIERFSKNHNAMMLQADKVKRSFTNGATFSVYDYADEKNVPEDIRRPGRMSDTKEYNLEPAHEDIFHRPKSEPGSLTVDGSPRWIIEDVLAHARTRPTHGPSTWPIPCYKIKWIRYNETAWELTDVIKCRRAKARDSIPRTHQDHGILSCTLPSAMLRFCFIIFLRGPVIFFLTITGI